MTDEIPASRPLRNRILRAAKRWLPDRPSLQLQHYMAHRCFADLRNPRSFSELLQVRKLSDSDPRLPVYADKVRAKELVEAELGAEWVIPTLWSGVGLPSREERRWPTPYVIKANHGCGWNLFIRSPVDEDWDHIERVSARWMRLRYKPYLREKFYDRICPALLVEPFVGDGMRLPIDYKFFCFGGRVEYVMAQSDREAGLRIETLDREWRPIPLRYAYDRPETPPPRPSSFERMRSAAEHLSRPFDFVRIDLYEVLERPLFGEFSFTPGSGFEPFEPPEFNLRFGQHWTARLA